MKKYEPRGNEHIHDAATRMLALANSEQDTVEADFNGVKLTVCPDGNARSVVDFYFEEADRRHKEWKKTPEGRRYIREKEESRVGMQRKYEALVQQLDVLDFSNDVAVLDWVYEFHEVSGYSNIVKHPNIVVALFVAHGYHPDVNNGDDYDENDRDNVARYIIGEMLDGLKNGRCLPDWAILLPVEEWKKKFLADA